MMRRRSRRGGTNELGLGLGLGFGFRFGFEEKGGRT